MNPHRLQALGLLLCLCVLAACSSPSKIQYYSLEVPGELNGSASSSDAVATSVGIGPITLPPTLQHLGIVSQTDSSLVKVSGIHLWAGDLDKMFTHVLSQQLATLSENPNVFPHPWDHRMRPTHQVKIHVEAFGGTLDGPVQLRLNWTLLGDGGKRVLLRQRQSYSTDLPNPGYAAYVTGLNALLLQFGNDLHQRLTTHWANP